MIGERKADKGKEMPPYEIRATINLENGGTAVVAEHYVHSVYTTTNAQGQTQTVETWLYGNVLVMYLDPQGKMLTASVLKKAQICSTSGSNFSLMQLLGLPTMPTQRELPYYGIAIMENKGNVYILYNENPKNAERLKSGKKPVSVRQRDSETQLVTFTPDGNISSSVLFKSKDKEAGYKMPLMPRESVQFSKNSMIVFGTKGKYMRAAKVTIK